MKRSIAATLGLTAVGALALAGTATATTVTGTASCEVAPTFNFAKHPTALHDVTIGVTVDGEVKPTITQAIAGPTATLTYPGLTFGPGSHTVVGSAGWKVNLARPYGPVFTKTFECEQVPPPAPPPPPSTTSPTPPATPPSDVVPQVKPPVLPPPDEPKHRQPKPKAAPSCAKLLAVGAGQKWLTKYHCAKPPRMLSACVIGGKVVSWTGRPGGVVATLRPDGRWYPVTVANGRCGPIAGNG